MPKKLSRAKLDAALKRAATVASSGPQSARSGRVLASGPTRHLPGAIVIEHVSSTAIRDVQYDDEARSLAITFVSGRTYIYEDVPPSVVAEFIVAESKGAYFNQNVRDQFEFRERRWT
jgi:hypothetical protein